MRNAVKGVRISYDHIEQILEWLEEYNISPEVYTIGVDGGFKKFQSLDDLIKSKGTKVTSICISDPSKITIMITLQYFLVDSEGIDRELIDKICSIMKQSRPRLFKLISFKFLVLLLLLTIAASLAGYFVFGMPVIYLLYYTVMPVIIFVLAGIYNNVVSGIDLIRKHEKRSFWQRKRDDIFLVSISTLFITPIGAALWEYILKPFIEK